MPTGVYKRTEQYKKSHKMAMNRPSVKKRLSDLSSQRKQTLGKHWKVKDTSKLGKKYRGKEHWNWKGGITNYKRKLFLNTKRRALKMGADGSHTEGEWETLKIQYGFTCPSCKKQEPEIILTEDHIIPLIKGGSNFIENIQPLCRSCNCKKNTKIIKYV